MMPRLHAGVFGVEMDGKKVINLVIMGTIAFALILAIQGVLGLVEKFKGDDQCHLPWRLFCLLLTRSCLKV